jgi:hypothetical protein
MDDETRQWLIIVAMCAAGLRPAYLVITGDGGVLATLVIICSVVVILLSGWQLRRIIANLIVTDSRAVFSTAPKTYLLLRISTEPLFPIRNMIPIRKRYKNLTVK